ncbi:ecto-ADP-ribosyltransferase 4-like [Paramisgurnus dabryanus]|uniref:ecto-ADP-ribosyltransferase 4-like n=1 Tax=Paramisgurnus dabryanus TaxID=90735 RepID=UPI0031F35C36
MLTTAALILIVTSNVVLGQDDSHPLDLADKSVDDQYDGCADKMNNLVVDEDYLNKERKANIAGFGDAWSKSENKTKGKKLETLTRNHLIAIYVYTGVIGGVHKKFNQDVRTGGEKYKNNKFSWYTLYFWLTRAIQTLKKTQNGCISTYRGTSVKFNGVKNKEIRFGSFASSSLERDIAEWFGTESCFEIKTCHGADVTEYSFHRNQKEVLIPPYETFEVTDIRNGKMGDWCTTVFELKSTGIKSNLNCKLIKKMKYHNVNISE